MFQIDSGTLLAVDGIASLGVVVPATWCSHLQCGICEFCYHRRNTVTDSGELYLQCGSADVSSVFAKKMRICESCHARGLTLLWNLVCACGAAYAKLLVTSALVNWEVCI